MLQGNIGHHYWKCCYNTSTTFANTDLLITHCISKFLLQNWPNSSPTAHCFWCWYESGRCHMIVRLDIRCHLVAGASVSVGTTPWKVESRATRLTVCIKEGHFSVSQKLLAKRWLSLWTVRTNADKCRYRLWLIPTVSSESAVNFTCISSWKETQVYTCTRRIFKLHIKKCSSPAVRWQCSSLHHYSTSLELRTLCFMR